MKYLFVSIAILLFLPFQVDAQVRNTALPEPSRGQRTIVADDEPTIDQVLAPGRKSSVSGQQIAYGIMALILLAVAGTYVSKLWMPNWFQKMRKGTIQNPELPNIKNDNQKL